MPSAFSGYEFRFVKNDFTLSFRAAEVRPCFMTLWQGLQDPLLHCP